MLSLYAATHSIQKVEVSTHDNNSVSVTVQFAHNTTAVGAHIAMMPEVWNKDKCENSIRENILQQNDTITKTIVIRARGTYYLHTHVIRENNWLHSIKEAANHPIVVQIEEGKYGLGQVGVKNMVPIKRGT